MAGYGVQCLLQLGMSLVGSETKRKWTGGHVTGQLCGALPVLLAVGDGVGQQEHERARDDEVHLPRHVVRPRQVDAAQQGPSTLVRFSAEPEHPRMSWDELG